jgi:RNA polymerase sigma-70 factor (ECF subfamily)
VRSHDPTPSRRSARDRELGQLLVKVARGERTAFPLLYGATHRQVFALVLHLVRDAEQCAEVTQEVYLKVWQTAGQFDPARGGAQQWIFLIARRCSVDRIRKAEAAKRHDLVHARTSIMVEHDETVDAVEDRLEIRRLHTALGALTTLQREAIRLAYFDGQTHVETARSLHVPINTAKSRIHDAVVRLRALLANEHEVSSSVPVSRERGGSRTKELSSPTSGSAPRSGRSQTNRAVAPTTASSRVARSR